MSANIKVFKSNQKAFNLIPIDIKYAILLTLSWFSSTNSLKLQHVWSETLSAFLDQNSWAKSFYKTFQAFYSKSLAFEQILLKCPVV